MSLTILGFIVSLIALAISAWTRLEAFTTLRRQRKVDLVRRVGDALNQALETRSIYSRAFTLRIIKGNSDSNRLGDPLTSTELGLRLEEINDLAEQTERLLKLATGGHLEDLNPVIMEAQIALLTKHKHDAEEAASQIEGMPNRRGAS
jgi:hypothetical protein